MRRAEFLRTAGQAGLAAWLGATSLAAVNAAAPPSRRPNVLWLSCEDIGPHLGCYGDPHARTPTLDRLARQGIRFSRAFTVAPVCAPNRSCIITGVYPTTLGTHHMRSGGEGTAGSSVPKLPEGIRCFTEYLRDAGYYCTNNVKEDYNFVTPATAWDESSNRAHWRNRPNREQPFFAVFNYTDTHEAAVRQTDDWHAKKTERLTPEQRQDPEKITPPPYHPDTPAVRKSWARYYELITTLDYWVADHLRALEEGGAADNTIVFFWSDHGASFPRCKRWLYDSGTHVPVIVRIPESWRGSWAPEAGRVDDRLISSIDFAPSVMNLVGLPIPSYMQGQPFLGPDQPAEREYVYGARDRMDERYDAIRMVRDKHYKYIRNYECFRPYGQPIDYCERGPIMQELRRLEGTGALPEHARWVARTRKPVEELYDTVTDPHEINNLASDPFLSGTLAQLREAHEKWMIETGDLGLLPEPELAEYGEKFGSRFQIVRGMETQGRELAAELMDIALRANGANPANERRLRASLNDKHAPWRYWAVIGLVPFGAANERIQSEVRALLNDPSGTVRVAAAQALIEWNVDDGSALDVLVRELSSSNEWVRLRAATALDEIGSRAERAIPALKNALNDPVNKYVVRVANRALNEMLGTANEVP